ncbi:MAG: hypothetical protein IPL15_07495 [Comamonadaceae bacterium]|uniref:hypothetical protein n=1 Tax=Candidatus Skiveiella danica TaxID=3386177 RepID=UPI00390A7044|nr:hypothetical protein [Comamonadaceae bacterium]
MRPAQALIELVKHSFLLDIEARDMLMRHFDDLTRLAALPIYFRLDYPRDYRVLRSTVAINAIGRTTIMKNNGKILQHESFSQSHHPHAGDGPHRGR